MIHVTAHACERYRERVNGSVSLAEAHAAIAASERVIEIAAAFGAPFVRQGSGAGLVLRGTTVVTVVGRGQRVSCRERCAA